MSRRAHPKPTSQAADRARHDAFAPLHGVLATSPTDAVATPSRDTPTSAYGCGLDAVSCVSPVTAHGQPERTLDAAPAIAAPPSVRR